MTQESYQDEFDLELESLGKEEIEARLRDITADIEQLSKVVPAFRHQDDDRGDMIRDLEFKKARLETRLSQLQ